MKIVVYQIFATLVISAWFFPVQSQRNTKLSTLQGFMFSITNSTTQEVAYSDTLWIMRDFVNAPIDSNKFRGVDEGLKLNYLRIGVISATINHKLYINNFRHRGNPTLAFSMNIAIRSNYIKSEAGDIGGFSSRTVNIHPMLLSCDRRANEVAKSKPGISLDNAIRCWGAIEPLRVKDRQTGISFNKMKVYSNTVPSKIETDNGTYIIKIHQFLADKYGKRHQINWAY